MYRNAKNHSHPRAPLALAAALACVLAGSALAQNGKSSPSDDNGDDTARASAGATDTKVLKTKPIPGMPVGPGARASTSGTVELASTTLKTANARDLSIRFTSECFVYTQNANAAAQDSGQSEAGVTTWIEVDGQPVPVAGSSDPSNPDDGKIGLCSRTQTLSTMLSDQEIVDLAVLSHAAYGFNWTALNADAGSHTIKVMARLDASVDGTAGADAAAVIGKRTLQVQAVKPAQAPEDKQQASSPSSS